MPRRLPLGSDLKRSEKFRSEGFFRPKTGMDREIFEGGSPEGFPGISEEKSPRAANGGSVPSGDPSGSGERVFEEFNRVPNCSED